MASGGAKRNGAATARRRPDGVLPPLWPMRGLTSQSADAHTGAHEVPAATVRHFRPTPRRIPQAHSGQFRIVGDWSEAGLRIKFARPPRLSVGKFGNAAGKLLARGHELRRETTRLSRRGQCGASARDITRRRDTKREQIWDDNVVGGVLGHAGAWLGGDGCEAQATVIASQHRCDYDMRPTGDGANGNGEILVA